MTRIQVAPVHEYYFLDLRRATCENASLPFIPMVDIRDILRETPNPDVVSSQSPNKTQQRAALNIQNKEKGYGRRGRD
jgi:hypothetical protein